MKQYIKGVAVLAFLFAAAIAQAQPTGTIDKIAAVVGKDHIILKSEIEMQLQQMKEQGGEYADADACMLLQQVMLQKLLVEQAQRDSVLVPEEEVEGTLDNRIRYYISVYGSKDRLEEIAGKTVYQIKEDARDVVRDQLMADKMRQQILQNVKITPAEVRTFFQEIPADSLPFFPATVEVGQVVIDPEVSPEVDAYTRQRLEEIRKDIVEGGKSFEVMAGLRSDDPGSRDNGGLYNDISRSSGDWDPDFIAAAFKLQNGEVSPIVKTQFGYHIIKMENRKGDVADIRHILLRPERTTADLKKSLEKLDSVRALIVSGKMSFPEAVGKFSTDEMAKRTAGMIMDPNTGNTRLSVDALDPALALMIDSLKPGKISQPHVFVNQRGEKSARIVYVKERTEPHKANLKDDYSNIQAVALQQKQLERMNKWIADKAPTYYIKLDPEYAECDIMKQWLAGAK